MKLEELKCNVYVNMVKKSDKSLIAIIYNRNEEEDENHFEFLQHFTKLT